MIDTIGNITLFTALILQLGIVLVNIFANKKFYERYNTIKTIHLASALLLLTSFFTLIYAFVNHYYEIIAVYVNSDNSMSTRDLIMATWAGRAGVLLLWATIASTITTGLLFYMDEDKDNPVIGRSVTIQLIMNMLVTSFNMAGGSTPFTTGNMYSNGLGLSPSLQSVWQQIHPPLAFLAYSAFIYPYALGIAALVGTNNNESMTDKGRRISRNLMIAGWGFVNLLIVAGSIWAYNANWNGFWAWDPVEVVSLILWTLVTVYFHSSVFTPPDHPLRYLSLTSGWVGVSFASFVVRSGLWSGFHGYAGIQKAIVFGTILMASILVVGFALRKSSGQIIPDVLKQLKEKTPHVLTWWSLIAIAIVNLVGLLVQLSNTIIRGDDSIPYIYYMFFNGLLFFTLLSLLIYCDVNSTFDNTTIITTLITIGTVLGGLLFFRYLRSTILVFVLSSVLFGILVTQVGSIFFNIRQKAPSRRIRTQLVHLSMIIMIMPYFMVDYGSERVITDANPNEEIYIEEFDISFILTKQLEDLDEPYPNYIINVTNGNGKTDTLTIEQGQHKGTYWNRGDWTIEPLRDIYFMVLDENTGFIINPHAPVSLQISEKPYANSYRISFWFQVVITLSLIIVISKPTKLTT